MKRCVLAAIVVGLGVVLAAAPLAAPGAAIHDTPGIVDTTTGIWRLWDPLRGEVSFYYGNPGDYPFVGDWNCDGVETPGLYRQSDGYVYLRNSNTQGTADISFFFGDPGDQPLAGDFDGDGCDTVALYRPSNGRFFVINRLGSGNGGLGAADLDYIFGNPGDVPFVGDFDGDGADTFGLHRKSTGRVYFRNSHSPGFADSDFIYGDPGDSIVAADWTGDGTDTVGIFRPAAAGFFLRYTNTQGIADQSVLLDATADDLMPVAGSLGLDGTVSFSNYPCVPVGYAGPFARIATSPPPPGTSQAIGVLGMSFLSSPQCDRAVITLGESGGVAFWETGVPTEFVPAGMAVTIEGNRLNVALPGIEERGQSTFLAGPHAFIVQDFIGPDLYVDVHYEQYRQARAFFLSNPARIVVDSVPVATPTGLRLGPVLGDDPLLFLRDPIDTGHNVTPPLHVVGYAALFEGSDVASLSRVGSSQPVVAEWTGCDSEFVEPAGSGCVYRAGSLGLGEFRFTIADVAPGTYELSVAFTPPADELPPAGVTEVFTVGASAPAMCTTTAMLAPIKAALDVPGVKTVEEIDLANCRIGYARVFVWLSPTQGGAWEYQQVFLQHAAGLWSVIASGLEISCPLDTVFQPPELATACEALDLR